MAAEYVELISEAGTTIYVNLARAKVVLPERSGSRIVFLGKDDFIDVKQPPEKIMEFWVHTRRKG